MPERRAYKVAHQLAEPADQLCGVNQNLGPHLKNELSYIIFVLYHIIAINNKPWASLRARSL